MTKKFNTNEELVADLMCHSPYGGLCQVFILEAIRHYAEQVASTTPPTKEEDTGFISVIAWHGIAIDILKRIEEQANAYKSNG
jgi:hypothetical protein